MVKTLPFNAEGMGSILGWGIKIPYASGPKNQNKTNNIVTHSVKSKNLVVAKLHLTL